MFIEDRIKLSKKDLELFNKLNIYTTTDLLEHYPYRYEIIRRTNLDAVLNKEKVVIDGIVESAPVINYYGKRKSSLKFNIICQNRRLQIIIYNRSYLKNNITIGKEITVIGNIDFDNNKIVASEIRDGLIEKEKIEQIYHKTIGLTNNKIASSVNEVLEDNIKIEDFIPVDLVSKYNFIDKKIAIKNIHKPASVDLLKSARKRISYEEFFKYMIKVNYLNLDRKRISGIKRNVNRNIIDKIIRDLPFELTKDQIKAIDDIYRDLTSDYQMNRLIQGDVGSGKTIVAFISIFINKISGYQSALMAPTEILAIQHYHNLIKLFPEFNIKLLTSSTKSKDRKNILAELEKGLVDVLIGTHSLIGDKINYNNLGLVITDEQHRFGVKERTSLKEKGISPDILSLSATPIPRTFALTIYGDMDVSNIITKPSGRKEVTTNLYKSSEVKKVLEIMYQELKLGHQIYVVAPLVENTEEDNEKNDIDTLYNNMYKAFGSKFNILKMHGKMKPDEKEDIMNQFKEKKAQILISTTVIEVGVDVKDATAIVIFNAEQFGLATLHQLRGRVGRNSLDSYCLLISDKETKRLNILVENTDGFIISEEDFKLRGSGDLFGAKQSGDMIFKVADIKRDFKLLQLCAKDSLEYLKRNESSRLIEKIVSENSYVS